MKLHVLAGCPFCIRVMYALELAGIEYQLQTYFQAVDLKTAEYLKMNPKGEAPVLETTHGVIYESGAVLRYVATLKPELGLNGRNPFEAAQVEMWMCNTGGFTGAVLTVFPQLFGKVPPKPEDLQKNLQNIHDKTPFLEEHLSNKEYLAGDSVTVADFAFLSILSILYQFIFPEEQRNKYPHILRYYHKLTSLEFYKKILGSNRRLANTEFKLPHPQQLTAPVETKVEEIPKKFDLLSFKTLFVNQKDRGTVCDTAFETYDKDSFSFWHARYDMHPAEGKELIATSNLLTNFVSRIHDLGLSKNIVAIHGIYGDEPKLEIRGLWFWRSSGFYEELKQHPSCEFIQWTRLDPQVPEDRTKIIEYWSHIKSNEGSVEGLNCKVLKII